MPDDRVHHYKRSIAEDAQLALQADPNDHLDWVVITAFYQALHWVDAFLAKTQRHPGDHRNRNREVRQDVYLKAIKRHYKRLYDASLSARYYPNTYRNRPNEVQRLLETDLQSIIDYISPLL